MGLQIDFEEEGKRRAVSLAGNELTIGRGPENSIVINDPRSSRQHCRLIRTPHGVVLEDLESRNGTILDGVPVKKSLIKPGAFFSIGSIRFRLEEANGGEPAVSDEDDGADEISLDDDSPELDLEPSVDDTPVAEVPPPPPPPRKERRASPPEKAKPKPLAAAGGGRGAPGAAGEAPRGAFLERIVDGKVVERISIEKASVVLGRGKECDVVLDDKRASTRHAKVLSEKGAFYVEDLGSTNGTLLNDRPVKRAILGRGAVIVIGNAHLRVILPASAASKAAASTPEAAAGAEEVIQFDAAKFLEADRSQHPALVAVMVLILGVVSYFTVDITRRMVRREDPDPRVESNRILNNWSFESGPPKDGKGDLATVPGWMVAPGDQGEIRARTEHAQHPGRYALELRSTGDADICRATYDAELGLESGREYLLEGYAVQQGGFAAGLLVEWLRPSKDGAVVVGRVFSDTARQAGEAVDVSLAVSAPATASQARVSCFVVGANASATFDRISFGPAAAPPAGTNGEPAAREERSLRAGTAENPVTLVLRQEGTFQIQRRQRPLITALWAGLPPEQDPQSFGPRLTAIRVIEGEAAAFTSEVPDEKNGRWLTVEARASLSGQDVQLQWRTGSSEGQTPTPLCLYLEVRDKSVPVEAHAGGDDAGDASDSAKSTLSLSAQAEGAPGAPAGTFRDVVVGDRDDRVSILFPVPVKLSTVRHPLDPTRKLLVVEGAPGGFDASLTQGSSHEASLAKRLMQDAEAAFRAGRVGEALQQLMSMKAQFPEESVELRRAESRIAEMRAAAQTEVKDLEEQLNVLRQTPTQVVQRLLLERAELARVRYQGTPEGAAAAEVLEQAKKLWTSLDTRKADEELQAIHELARKHFAAGELGLAELYFRWVAEGDKEGSLKREAENVLKTIEGRRTRDRNILLQ